MTETGVFRVSAKVIEEFPLASSNFLIQLLKENRNEMIYIHPLNIFDFIFCRQLHGLN
ncbi:MAG: hypothetical protein HRT74_04720 [Flavobacteriales bacterium]|nr:hypothetical protein [Flavobacteriales bacterium]